MSKPKPPRDGRRAVLMSRLASAVVASLIDDSGGVPPEKLLRAASRAVMKDQIMPLVAWERSVGGPKKAFEELLSMTGAGALPDAVREILDYRHGH